MATATTVTSNITTTTTIAGIWHHPRHFERGAGGSGLKKLFLPPTVLVSNIVFYVFPPSLLHMPECRHVQGMTEWCGKR